MKVLVVDDVDLNRKLLRVILRSAGHETAEVADGVEALAALAGGGFDAMITDILMPRMDGYRLCYEVRRFDALRDLPIIVHSSTYVSDADESLALSVGADAFLRKPAASETLLAALERVSAADRPRRTPSPPAGQLQTLKEYSEGLVRKLEERNLDLEAARLDLAATNAELSRSEERYRTLFEASPLPMLLIDPQTLGLAAVNDAAIRQYGYSREELLAMSVLDLGAPEEHPRLRDRVRRRPGRNPYAGRWRHRRKDGTFVLEDVYRHAVTIAGRELRLVVLRDVSERHRLEERLRQAQTMEALGRLAGGVAHDFSNLVTAILLYTDLLARAVPEGSRQQRDLAEIRRAAESAVAITRQLLAFGRRQVLEPRVVELGAVVAALEPMLGRVAGEGVELVLRRAPGRGLVHADPEQLERVILNLVVNARDAMPEGGTIVLETAEADVDESEADEHPGMTPGRYVMLAVRDTGVGMDETTAARALEPFFSTKGEKGTGLGLATSYGIIEQSAGTLWVESEPGRGTTIRIFLPRVEDDAAAQSTPPQPP